MEVMLRRPHRAPNGFARAKARIDAALAQCHGLGPQLRLTVMEEEEMRDCTQAQLGMDGVCAGRAPTRIWRTFLMAYFARRNIALAFDARVLTASGRPLHPAAATARPSENATQRAG
jgi:hypothetical protein